jgi:hypothetical protein
MRTGGRDDARVKTLAVGFALAFVVLGGFVAPAMGHGVTVGYTVNVRFFYPLCFLYNLQVTIYDQTGSVVGTGMSPDGTMIIIPVRTETATISLTATASGYASGPLTNYLANQPFWLVSGKSTIPVQETGGNYWITVPLSQEQT